MTPDRTSTGAPLFNSTCQQSSYNDLQLTKNIFANLATDPFVYKCTQSTYTNASAIPDCSPSFLTFCIGNRNQQHACLLGSKCYAVDWSGNHTSACSKPILDYANVQQPGLNTPCCNSDFCVQPQKAPQFASDPTLQCSDPGRQLWLCVNDGISAECINPQNKTICAGNLTVTTTAAIPSGSTSASSGLSETARNAIISVSVVVGLSLFIGVLRWLGWWGRHTPNVAYAKNEPELAYVPPPAPPAYSNDYMTSASTGGSSPGDSHAVYGGNFTNVAGHHYTTVNHYHAP